MINLSREVRTILTALLNRVTYDERLEYTRQALPQFDLRLRFTSDSAWSQDDGVIESVEKLVNIWNTFSPQQMVMRLKPLDPGLAISTCVPLDHMFTGDVYFAVLRETNQENVRLYVLPCDAKKFGHGRRYHLSQRRQETSQVNQMAHIRNAVLG